MPIVQGTRVVVVSGEYGVGQHGKVKYLKHAGPAEWQHGALVEMDGGWYPGSHLRERDPVADKHIWFPLYDLRREDENN